MELRHAVSWRDQHNGETLMPVFTKKQKVRLHGLTRLGDLLSKILANPPTDMSLQRGVEAMFYDVVGGFEHSLSYFVVGDELMDSLIFEEASYHLTERFKDQHARRWVSYRRVRNESTHYVVYNRLPWKRGTIKTTQLSGAQIELYEKHTMEMLIEESGGSEIYESKEFVRH